MWGFFVVVVPPCKSAESPEVTLRWAVPWEQGSMSESLRGQQPGPGPGGEVLPWPGPCRAWGAVWLAEGPLGERSRNRSGETGRVSVLRALAGSCRIKGAGKPYRGTCLALARLPGATLNLAPAPRPGASAPGDVTSCSSHTHRSKGRPQESCVRVGFTGAEARCPVQAHQVQWPNAGAGHVPVCYTPVRISGDRPPKAKCSCIRWWFRDRVTRST